MSLHRAIYFASLVGALGGLLAWVLGASASVAMATTRAGWVADSIFLVALCLAVAPLLLGYFDRLQTGRVHGRLIWLGLGIGCGAALLAVLLDIVLRRGVVDSAAPLYRVGVWALAASLLGAGVGARWVKSNRARMLHTYAGGLIGGLLGGLLFTFLGTHIPEISQAFALMLVGAGTSFGAAISPVFLRDGLVQFISSGDGRAHAKYSKIKKQWELDHGESYVLGSQPTTQTGTRYEPGASIFIPDAALAPRHAVLFAKDGRFFIARHPDTGGAAGIAKWVLRVRGKTVTTSLELQELDDLLVGKTALRFSARKLP